MRSFNVKFYKDATAREADDVTHSVILKTLALEDVTDYGYDICEEKSYMYFTVEEGV
jgi:hypothetical protein